jgi:hypothetical protein
MGSAPAWILLYRPNIFSMDIVLLIYSYLLFNLFYSKIIIKKLLYHSVLCFFLFDPYPGSQTNVDPWWNLT